jgi:hypothetical protein
MGAVQGRRIGGNRPINAAAVSFFVGGGGFPQPGEKTRRQAMTGSAHSAKRTG